MLSIVLSSVKSSITGSMLQNCWVFLFVFFFPPPHRILILHVFCGQGKEWRLRKGSIEIHIRSHKSLFVCLTEAQSRPVHEGNSPQVTDQISLVSHEW